MPTVKQDSTINAVLLNRLRMYLAKLTLYLSPFYFRFLFSSSS